MRNFISFEDADAVVKKFNFKSVSEFRKWVKCNKDYGIPYNPDIFYRNLGWVNYKSFFGKKYNKDFVSYEYAKNIVILNNIKNKKKFDIFIKDSKGLMIPSAPNISYKDYGWVSWGSFLSTKNVYKKNFMCYNDAVVFLKAFKLKTQKEYLIFIKDHIDLPVHPNKVFESKWINWKTYLSIDKLTNLEKNKIYINYDDCVDYIKKFNFKKKSDFDNWIERPSFIPGTPYSSYKKSGWISWYVFLSNKNISSLEKGKRFLDYDSAVNYLSIISLLHKFDYQDFIKRNEIDFLPKRPEYFYRKNWTGYLHYLGCESIRTSFGERKIVELLESNNISYVREKRFNECRNKKPLPFDFYLIDLNICIEYDGQHHFNIVSKYGGDIFLKKVKNNDKIKNDYCSINNIELIRIPYNKKGHIEEILRDNKIIN